MRKALLIAALAGSLASAAPAAEMLTLGEAMARARSRAHAVRAAGSRAAAADERLRQARAYRRPQVRLQEIWTRTDSPADAFGLLLNQERFSLAEFAAGDPNDPEAIESALTRLEVELPLYTGGEIGGRLRQAELASRSSRLSSAWAEETAAWEAGAAYLRLIQAREGVALLEGTLDTVAAHVELARAYVEQGLLVGSELLRAEVEEARVRDLWSEARGRERLAAAALAFRMGETAPGDWTLEPLSPPALPPAGLEELLADAERRLDLEAARRRLEAGELEESILRAPLKPRLGLVARHDRYGEEPFGSSGASSAVLAVGSIELFAGGRHRAAAASARLEAEAGALDVERFREAVRLEVRDAWVEAATERERQATAAAALGAAREAQRIVRERFEQGIARTIDVLEAVTARREAETRELTARAEAHLASMRLALVAGRRPESALAALGEPE